MRRRRKVSLRNFTFKKLFVAVGIAIANFYYHIEAHWPRYLLSAITATFTGQAAFILTGQMYYTVMAILLAEGMWLYWLSRIEVFENIWQAVISTLMFTISCIAIISTDIASAILIVHQSDTTEFYKVVPDWVNWVVTNITPVLAASNLIAYGLFEFMSDTNRDRRVHAARTRHVDRIVKASTRDVARLRARNKVLRVQQRLERVQRRHNRQYGEAMVMKANQMMRLELLEKKAQKEDNLFDKLASLFGKNDIPEPRKPERKKRKYKWKNK